jgi:hypothetical protein
VTNKLWNACRYSFVNPYNGKNSESSLFSWREGVDLTHMYKKPFYFGKYKVLWLARIDERNDEKDWLRPEYEDHSLLYKTGEFGHDLNLEMSHNIPDKKFFDNKWYGSIFDNLSKYIGKNCLLCENPDGFGFRLILIGQNMQNDYKRFAFYDSEMERLRLEKQKNKK